MRRREAILGLGLGLASSCNAFAVDRPGGRFPSGRSPVYGAGGAIATSQPLATQAGVQVLREGGSAADAAIAAAALLAVCEPMMSGPGGDLSAMVWRPQDRRLMLLQAIGSAPAAASPKRIWPLAGDTMPRYGALSISAPGAVAGWAALHAACGRLSFERLMEPAIHYAERGAPIGPQTAEDWTSLDWLKGGPGVLGDFSAIRALYQVDGRLPRAGDLFRNPALARTLRLIAATKGRDLYTGETARRIIETVQAAGGLLSAADLAATTAWWEAPLTATYRGVVVAEAGAPSQGVTALQILKLFEQVAPGSGSLNDPERLHLMIECVRLAFEDRAALIGDPRASTTDPASLLAQARLRRQAETLRPERAGPAVSVPLQSGDTSYLAVADRDGQMVSLITSISGPFGSGVASPEAGFVLQNRAAGFNLKPGHPNVIAPGKRPFHTIIPGFALRGGEPWMAFGVMGGAMQPQGHAQFLSRVIDEGMDVQAAGEAPRFRLIGGPQPEGGAPAPNRVHVETGLSDAAPRLRALGHEVEIGLTRSDLRFGGFQAVACAGAGVFSAGSEPRQDGQAAAI